MAISQIDRNTFLVRVCYKGMRAAKTVHGSRTLANTIEIRMKSDMQKGVLLPETKRQKITFAEIAEKYWNIRGSKTRGAHALIFIYKKIVKHFGNKLVENITPEEVQEFYNNKLEETCSSTANRYYTLFRAIINKAINLRIYKGQNPCIGVVRQSENAPRKEYFTKEQIQALLSNAKDSLMPVIAFALMTGMRRGEILNLLWTDLDFTANSISITESKSGKSREVPMLPALKQLLLDMGPKESGKVFTITAPELRFAFRELLNKLKLSEYRFHSCRHSFASHFVMNGGNLNDLQNILGHHSAAMTQRYAHLSPSHIKKAIQVMDNVVMLPQEPIKLITQGESVCQSISINVSNAVR